MTSSGTAFDAIRARALQLAAEGAHDGWDDVRDALLMEGFMEVFDSAIANNEAFRAELEAACTRARSSRT